MMLILWEAIPSRSKTVQVYIWTELDLHGTPDKKLIKIRCGCIEFAGRKAGDCDSKHTQPASPTSSTHKIKVVDRQIENRKDIRRVFERAAVMDPFRDEDIWTCKEIHEKPHVEVFKFPLHILLHIKVINISRGNVVSLALNSMASEIIVM